MGRDDSDTWDRGPAWELQWRGNRAIVCMGLRAPFDHLHKLDLGEEGGVCGARQPEHQTCKHTFHDQAVIGWEPVQEIRELQGNRNVVKTGSTVLDSWEGPAGPWHAQATFSCPLSIGSRRCAAQMPPGGEATANTTTPITNNCHKQGGPHRPRRESHAPTPHISTKYISHIK